MSEDERKRKYPSSNHAADPNCKRCNGTGERQFKGTATLSPRTLPCICIFVDHSGADYVASLISDVARKELGK